MPLDDFMCEECKLEFEELHKVDEDVECPKCKKKAKKKVGKSSFKILDPTYGFNLN